jgi:hypothetical protein
MWGALSDERVCRLQLLLALARAVILRSESRGTRGHILLTQIRDFPFRRLLRLAVLRCRYATRLHTGKISVSSVESYVTTDGQTVSRSVGQSVSLSWNKAIHLRLTIRFSLLPGSCGIVMGRSPWQRTGLSFTIATGPRQRSHSRVRILLLDSRRPSPSHIATDGLSVIKSWCRAPDLNEVIWHGNMKYINVIMYDSCILFNNSWMLHTKSYM